MPADQTLATDLPRLTALVQKDLADRASSEPAMTRLRDEYESAKLYGGTAGTWHIWLDEKLSQTAAAWVLATVIIRFCEDNGLLDSCFLDDTPTGGPVIKAVDRLLTHPVMSKVLGSLQQPLERVRPGPQTCDELLAFWRHRTPDGALVHDFTDSSLSTAFLADLAPHLDERARRGYGQVATPDFVVDLLLDLTLQPFLTQHSSVEAGLADLRLVDPACGTGTFLLGAYHRIFRQWTETRPDMTAWQRAARALRSVHGCDIDPCAVALTRFRLLVAAMNSAGEPRLESVPDLSVVVAAGDSLLQGRPDTTDTPPHLPVDPAYDIDAQARRHRLLEPGSYDVVTGNPPYVSVKDKALAAAYREAYESCGGVYSLSVPFTELAFRLARTGPDAGRVGLLVSNSFMKREAGRGLVERVLARVEISHLVDTSGAYLPGHGTPTAILVGRNRTPDTNVPVHVVVSRRGEGGAPAVPGQSPVWGSLRELAFQAGLTSTWAESYFQDRRELSAFPWSLTPSAARAVLRRMEGGESLSNRVDRIGYAANTGADDLFCGSAATFRRHRVEDAVTTPVLTGSEVRDWSARPTLMAFFPRRPGRLEPVVDLSEFRGHHRRLWPYRTVLRKRTGAKKTSPWYDWHHISADTGTRRWSIVFPWVATHPHFSLLRGRAVPLNSAPVINLPLNASEDECLGLLGALNSAAVSFWLKQMSQSKGQSRIDQPRGVEADGEPWAKIYEFTSTRLLRLPLPAALPVREARELDRLAVESQRVLEEIATPRSQVTQESLNAARGHWLSMRSRMIALQEELDWKVYAAYGLIADDELTTPVHDLPDLALGERAFEIMLAKQAARGEVTTQWFTRHAASPVTDPPRHWPSDYRRLVHRRLHAIEENPLLRLLEQPEYKRRWATEPWDVLISSILRQRLLSHCEAANLWYETSDRVRRPVVRTVDQLATLLVEEPDFIAVAAIYAPGTAVTDLLLRLLSDEYVPQASPLRYKKSGLVKRRRWEEVWEAQHRDAGNDPADVDVPPRYTATDFLRPSYWRLRGKYDVPNETFVSFSASVKPLSATTPLGWAGWTARERAEAALRLLDAEDRADAQRPEEALPLLRALADILPWVGGDVADSDDEPGRTAANLRREYDMRLTRFGVSPTDVNAWQPPAPRRGRPRKDG
ncbi:BREX-2 system adenine-specific DNA-methyltransferase PglX [Streptomyces broussonetiae]|uniref:site-specific DNA-methyltransferase (adenine-specific) n=1 Tax=Streptomyces broussonetiae TaxID=2686304 RepID=A0ABV5EKR2_9ACTN